MPNLIDMFNMLVSPDDPRIPYDSKKSMAELYEKLISLAQFKSDGKNIYQPINGTFVIIPGDQCERIIRSYFTPETRMNLSQYKISQLIDCIKSDPDSFINTSCSNTGWIKFNNGYINAYTGDTYPSYPIYTWAIINANYVSLNNVNCKNNFDLDYQLGYAPNFKEFLITSLNYDKTPQKALLLLEIIGYILSDYTCAKKAFFLIGQPNSGKSKLLEWLKTLMGDSVTQIALSELNSRFNKGALRDKRLNICSEIPSNKFPAIETFKAIVSCDPIRGEYKGIDGFDFTPKAKLIFAGNNMPVPHMSDGTLSIIDRMQFLLFLHSVPRDKRKFNLVELLMSEKDIICSIAVNALRGLIKRNFEFTQPSDSLEFETDYKYMLNPFDVFIKEACQKINGEKTFCKDLWQGFKDYCNNNGFALNISENIFYQKLTSYGYQKIRQNEKNKKKTYYKDIVLKATENNFEPALYSTLTHGE